MEVSLPSAKDWHYLFSRLCEEGPDINDWGVEMRDFCLSNLAASDPLKNFAPAEMDTEGNLFNGYLPAAWLAATLCMGSIYLFYDIKLQTNRLNAQTFADMLDHDDEYLIPTLGDPTTAWTHMPLSEQQDSISFTHAQCTEKAQKTVA